MVIITVITQDGDKVEGVSKAFSVCFLSEKCGMYYYLSGQGKGIVCQGSLAKCSSNLGRPSSPGISCWGSVGRLAYACAVA